MPSPIPTRWEAVVLAGDGRLYMPCAPPKYKLHPPEHREVQERLLLRRAQTQRDPELRRLAVTATGRIGLDAPSTVTATVRNRDGSVVAFESSGPIDKLLNDDSPLVRRAAATAIGASVSGVQRELREESRPSQEQIASARRLLERRAEVEKDPEVLATIWETVGRLRYQDIAVRDEVQAVLVGILEKHRTNPSAVTLGAAKGLEALIRGNPKREVNGRTREALRAIALFGATDSPVPTTGGEGTAPVPGKEFDSARARRLALIALQTARDDDVETLVRAGRDVDWQVRRLVALRLDSERVDFKATIEDLARDTIFQVRFEMVNVLARHATRTRDCTDLLRYFDDPEPTVVLRAIDVLPAPCGENDDVIKRLANWTEGLKTPLEAQSWHIPAHALEALARLRPDAGRPFLEEAAKHPVWQVRARTAAACEAFKDEETASALAADPEPNVRNAALETLIRLQSPARFAAAFEALKLDDYQLIRTAALALRGAPDVGRDDVVNALLDTLRRLTASLSDTSRDPRVAILERLGEILPPQRSADLAPFREDFDLKVREAARDALSKITQAESFLPPGEKYRYPYQPVKELSRLPKTAVISMEGAGDIHLELLGSEAPVTVARFSELARAGYYDGLTFHRIVPNFVIQGGSPGANEYAGVARYMRDEVGVEPHTRGAVGISTRGPDTGD
ncbi:MAG TPA: peptidylprolyl isomerase, partial [Vicinamibacterales bacterium]